MRGQVRATRGRSWADAGAGRLLVVAWPWSCPARRDGSRGGLAWGVDLRRCGQALAW